MKSNGGGVVNGEGKGRSRAPFFFLPLIHIYGYATGG